MQVSSLAERLAALEPVKTTARILTIDIERLPGHTRLFDQRVRGGFIGINNWTKLPSLLCFAAKWYDTRSVEFAATWDSYDDMVLRSWQLYDEADIVVTYNGRRFDNKHLRGAWLLAGLTPPRPWKDVDLFVSGAQFGFESRSLDHLCRRLGVQGKTGHYNMDEAEAAADGDVKAQRSLKRYNIGDVRATERVYDALRPWLTNHPHLGLYEDIDDAKCCNKCGSSDIVQDGYTYTALTKYALFRCQSCGGLVRANNRKGNVATRPVS